MDSRGEKRGLKRNRSVSSSLGSSPVSPANAKKIKMGQWKAGLYNETYLTLLHETMTGKVVFTEKLNTRDFWDAFTDMLNVRIKRSLPPHERNFFEDFAPYQVTNYGKSLRHTYYEYKDRPRIEKSIEHFDLFQKVFKKCGYKVPVFPSKTRMLNAELKSKSKRSKKSRSTEMCSSSSCESSGTMCNAAEATATQLIVLLNAGNITRDQAVHATYKLKDDSIRIQWLKMNRKNQIKYVKDLGDEFVQGSSHV